MKLLKRAVLKTKNLVFGRPYVCVAIGDSTIEGIGASKPEKSFSRLVYAGIKRRVRNAVFHNFGIGGARVRDVHHKIDEIIRLWPNLVLVSIGTNDIIRLTSFSDFKEHYQHLMQRLSRETDATLVVSNIPDITMVPKIPGIFHPIVRQKVHKYNEIIHKYTRRTKGILIDLYKESKKLKNASGFIAKDGLHPSDAGYSYWATLVLSKLLI